MTYRTICTILTDSETLAGTLAAAAQVARREDAHLSVLCLGVDRTQVGYFYAGATPLLQQQVIEQAQQDARALEEAARAALAREDVRWSIEAAVAQYGGLTTLVAVNTRFADLVVLPKPYGTGRTQEAEAVLEAALFETQTPVLVVPEGGLPAGFGSRILIAWNQSDEALAATRAALPFAARADLVNVTVIAPPDYGPERSDPGGPLGEMLARHGANVEVSVLAKTAPRVSEVIMRHARDIDANLVVMGAYGHSRFREAILGGATRNMLESATLPVLMAH